MEESARETWLLLIHQIPPEPGYLRVKIGRRLQRIGAVSIKNSVYVLPHNDQFHEDFQWILREIGAGGGDAMVCEAAFIEGLSDPQVKHLFQSARDEDYRKFSQEANQLNAFLSKLSDDDPQWPQSRRDFSRLKRRLEELTAIDYFNAPGKGEAEAALLALEGGMRKLEAGATHQPAADTVPETYHGRTWVTRAGVNVDRMASAWLIRRSIDSAARFKFVSGRNYSPAAGELRYDMFEAEFTHEGEDCTFEVLMRRMALNDPALTEISEIVHDIDLKDGKFERPEADGIGRVIAGIVMTRNDDEERLARGMDVFDDLVETFRRAPKRKS